MYRLTVLMPVYNGGRFLAETMRSVLSQTYRDFEFLIIDDGSTDQSKEIVRGFNDPRIRLLTNPQRLKLSGALNRGIDESVGTYIARMDADDIALPDRLMRQIEFLDTNPAIGLCGTWIERFGTGRGEVDKYFTTSDQVKVYSLFDCPFAHPTVMFRKELFVRHDLCYDGSFYPTEDYELWARALDCFPGTNLGEVLLRYRVHADSMTCSDWQEMDSKGAQIAEYQLKKLGLNVSPDELVFHRNIGRGESYVSASINEVCRGEEWLLQLENANAESKHFDTDAFRVVLSLIWFRLCMHAAPLGFEVVRCYSKSQISRNDTEKAKRMAILTMSVIKNRIVNPLDH